MHTLSHAICTTDELYFKIMGIIEESFAIGSMMYCVHNKRQFLEMYSLHSCWYHLVLKTTIFKELFIIFSGTEGLFSHTGRKVNNQM